MRLKQNKENTKLNNQNNEPKDAKTGQKADVINSHITNVSLFIFAQLYP